jgi:hypothetical protein
MIVTSPPRKDRFVSFSDIIFSRDTLGAVRLGENGRRREYGQDQKDQAGHLR